MLSISTSQLRAFITEQMQLTTESLIEAEKSNFIIDPPGDYWEGKMDVLDALLQLMKENENV